MTQDVTIPVNLDAYCTRKNLGPYMVISALLNGIEIIDLIKKIPNKECEITDQWIREGMDQVESVSVNLELECTFDSDGDLDDVCLCCESIIDIIDDTVEDDIYTTAKAGHIADLKDRGIKYKGGA